MPLLDNMDGRAAGIALIAALYLVFLFHHQGDTQHVVLALAPTAAVAGFLLHNFMRRRFSWAMRQPFSRLGAVMAFIAGATAVLIKRFSHSLRLAITLFTACLARVEIVFEEEGKRKQAQKLTVLFNDLRAPNSGSRSVFCRNLFRLLSQVCPAL